MATEKRLIDANALEFIPDSDGVANGVLIWGGRGGKTMTTVLAALKKMVDNAPTVDAVEVVRCKDCKYAKNMAPIGESKYMIGECFLREEDEIEFMVYDDDFCSYGEKKEA